MTLLLLIAIPLLSALVVILAPASRAKWIATVGTIIPLIYFVWISMSYAWADGANFHETLNVPWFESLGLEFSLGADSVSMLLIGLTVFLGPIIVIGSFTAVSDRLKTYYGWLLVLQAAMTGVFAARDVALFYIFFEFTLVPLYVLISLYGSSNRKAAATKFFLYTFTGSLITLAALAYVAWHHASVTGAWTFSFDALSQTARLMPTSTQIWVFVGLLIGFAVKVPLFPFHTWLPLAHTEAPTAGSVVLAGVLLKLGTYGIYRFAIGFVPAGAIEMAPFVAGLAIVGILYAALICWVQRDVKKLVAYSSVSHLGFCVLGLMAFSSIGLTGSILYMVNHGLSTGALFLMIGMIYERYHTRSMDELGGLAARMPVWSTFMVFFAMASVGLPGLNGFVSEFLCLLGAFQAGDVWGSAQVAGVRGELGPWFAAVAAIGLIVTAIYILFMVGKVVWGTLNEPAGYDPEHSPLPADLNAREIGILVPLAGACLLLGLYPAPVLRVLEAPTQQVAAMVNEAREQMVASEGLADARTRETESTAREPN